MANQKIAQNRCHSNQHGQDMKNFPLAAFLALRSHPPKIGRRGQKQSLCRRTASAWLLIGASVLLCYGVARDAHAQTPQTQLPREVLRVGLFKVDAQVASTPEQRSVGLMHRQRLPKNEGMLFVFEQPQLYCFWMKNTPLPLSIAFIDARGRITNIAEMKPHSEAKHCASEPVRFALEMNTGWFDQHRAGVGSRIRGSFWPAP